MVGEPGWAEVLESNTQAFMDDFVTRLPFTSAYPTTLTPIEFVNSLFNSAGVTPAEAERAAAISEFGTAETSADTEARGRALRRVAENQTFAQQEFNKAVVLMQYFGFLRRNPDVAPERGVNFDGSEVWLGQLGRFTGGCLGAEVGS